MFEDYDENAIVDNLCEEYEEDGQDLPEAAADGKSCLSDGYEDIPEASEPVPDPVGISGTPMSDGLIEDIKTFNEKISKFNSEYTDEEPLQDEKKEKKCRRIGYIFKKLLPLLIFLFYAGVLLYLVVTCRMLVNALFNLDRHKVTPDAMSVIMPALSTAMFLVSSLDTLWNYKVYKMTALIMTLGTYLLFPLRLFYEFISVNVLPLLFITEPNPWATKDKWIFLMRYVTITIPVVFSVWVGVIICRTVFNRYSLSAINRFRLEPYVTVKPNRRWSYDLFISNNMTTGLTCRSLEEDRYMHTLINGNTGTAKTSSTILPMIYNDLKHRRRNEDKLKKTLLKMLKRGEVYLKENPEKDGTFNAKAFAPNRGFKDKYESVIRKYPICGITVLAPDASLTDEVCKLAIANGFKINLVDPLAKPGTEGGTKDYFVPFNPFYISPDTPEWAIKETVFKRAAVFADVLQGIANVKGKTDYYFESVNRTVTVSISICLMLTWQYIEGNEGTQPTPADVQNMINDFSRIQEYYKKLCEINRSIEDHPYQFVIDFIRLDIIGPGQKEMTEHSGGLRYLMNEFIQDPYVRRALCPKGGINTISMKKCLSDGEITAINYARERDKASATGFGTFCLLSLFDAVLSRPIYNNAYVAPHFIYVDELPVIIHPQISEVIAQARKFKTALIFSIQTLAQMSETKTTEFLKGVLLGVGTHYVFGRCGIEEMKTYEALGGEVWTEVETDTVSQSTISAVDTSLNYSVRTSHEKEARVSGTDIRESQFQEVTLYTIWNNNLVPPKHCKVHFLDKKVYEHVRRPAFDWDSLASMYSHESDSVPASTIREAEGEMLSHGKTTVKLTGSSSFESNDFDAPASTLHAGEEDEAGSENNIPVLSDGSPKD